jgi:hypothetical protein
MRAPLILAVLTAFAAYPCAAAATRLEQKIIQMEKDSWAAWERNDTAFWQRFLSDDHLEVHSAPRLAGKAEVVAHIGSKACAVADYRLDDFTFRQLGPDTALLVYRASQATKCGNYSVPSPVWATSMFQRRNGRWLNVFYSHTPIPEPPKATEAK